MGFKGDLTRLFPKWMMSPLPQYLMEEIAQFAGDVCQESAQRNAPVLTGELRDHIRTRIEKAPGYVKTITSIKDEEIPYAAAVAYGDKRHSGDPFMENARDESLKETKIHIKEISRAAILKAKAASK